MKKKNYLIWINFTYFPSTNILNTTASYALTASSYALDGTINGGTF